MDRREGQEVRVRFAPADVIFELLHSFVAGLVSLLYQYIVRAAEVDVNFSPCELRY